MKVKVSFIANDGKEFDTEQACIVYESATNAIKTGKFGNGVIMFHRFGKVLNENMNTSEEIAVWFKNTSAVLVFDRDKAQNFFNIMKLGGTGSIAATSVPDATPGLYILNVEKNCWYAPLRDDVQTLNKVVERYQYLSKV